MLFTYFIMILTLDIEYDWGFETTKNFIFLRGIFDWLEDTKSSATLFVTGNIAESLKDIGLPKRIEIASHSMTHPDLTKISENDLVNEIQESKATLESILKTKVKGFRAPYFMTPSNLWEILAQSGYKYSSSLVAGYFPKRYHNKIKPFPFKRNGITEVPIPHFKLIHVPFGLSFMRLMWPFSKILTPKKPYLFYYYPTELLAEPPGPKEGKLIRILYGINRGQKARKILYQFLQKQGQTVSILEYLSGLKKQLTEIPIKSPNKIATPESSIKKNLKTKENPGDSGQGVRK